MPNTNQTILCAPHIFDEDGEPTSIIERIYTTKGDNSYNFDGIKNDKMVGVVIKGDIYWLQDEFATLHEIQYLLARFNIRISTCGRWGVTDSEGRTTYTDAITKIAKHHDDVFSDGSSYVKRAKTNDAKNSIWWTVEEVINEFFAEDNAPA